MGLKLQPFHLKRSIKGCYHCQVSSQALSLHSLRYDVYQLCAVQQMAKSSMCHQRCRHDQTQCTAAGLHLTLIIE
jgi:hypothetical protein